MTFLYELTMKKLVKNRHMRDRLQLSAATLAQWWHLVASNKALNLLHQAMCAVTHRRIAMAIKTASFLVVFVDCFFVCLLPWRPLGQYRASSCPMPVSSSFRSSPGHAALGDAICIAPAHHHGHRNGRRTRCICSSLLILSSTITVAKDHVMVH